MVWNLPCHCTHLKFFQPPSTFLINTILHTPKGSAFPPVHTFVMSFLAPYVFYWPKRRVSLAKFYHRSDTTLQLWKFAPELWSQVRACILLLGITTRRELKDIVFNMEAVVAHGHMGARNCVPRLKCGVEQNQSKASASSAHAAGTDRSPIGGENWKVDFNGFQLSLCCFGLRRTWMSSRRISWLAVVVRLQYNHCAKGPYWAGRWSEKTFLPDPEAASG